MSERTSAPLDGAAAPPHTLAMAIETWHHGTHHPELPRHEGLCLAGGGSDRGYYAASEYARVRGGADATVYEVQVDLAGLTVEVIEVDVRACRDADHWPGDTEQERAALVARGVDAIIYDDACVTRAHRTLRLLSPRALAAIVAVDAYEPA